MAKRKADTRKIVCGFCNASHYIKDGGWIITGNGKVFCHSIDKSCLVRKHNDEGYDGKRTSISEMWEAT